MRTLIFACFAVAALGCGSSTTTTPDMMKVGADMQKFSACGHPGDTGNSKHVGQYCGDSATSCPMGTVCSSLANSTLPPDQQTFYCTIQCMMSAQGTPDTAECGESSVCLCKAIGCGCVPVSCAPAGMSG